MFCLYHFRAKIHNVAGFKDMVKTQHTPTKYSTASLKQFNKALDYYTIPFKNCKDFQMIYCVFLLKGLQNCCRSKFEVKKIPAVPDLLIKIQLQAHNVLFFHISNFER